MKERSIESAICYLLVLPFIIFLFLFLIFPIGFEFIISFFNEKMEFMGFEYFRRLFVDPAYIESLINTALYVGIGVNVKMFLALLLANTTATMDFRGKRLYRTLIMIPWVIPLVPSALNFRWMLDADYGIVNQVLKSIGFSPLGWLIQPQLAMSSVIFIHIWTNLPFWALIILSGLQSIPVELYDAAKVDGAGSYELFKYITLPLIKRLYIICTILSTIWTMGDFTTIWVLTEGGPANATQIVATLAYREAFKFGNFGYAASMFIPVLPVLAILVIVLLRILKR
jgi:multiple sugar transport system permease protein